MPPLEAGPNLPRGFRQLAGLPALPLSGIWRRVGPVLPRLHPGRGGGGALQSFIPATLIPSPLPPPFLQALSTLPGGRRAGWAPRAFQGGFPRHLDGSGGPGSEGDTPRAATYRGTSKVLMSKSHHSR